MIERRDRDALRGLVEFYGVQSHAKDSSTLSSIVPFLNSLSVIIFVD